MDVKLKEMEVMGLPIVFSRETGWTIDKQGGREGMTSETSILQDKRAAQRRLWLLGLLIVIGLVAAAYYPAYRAGYIWDDGDYITQNRFVQSWDGLREIWFSTKTPQYYPAVFTSFWVEHKIWGLHPAGYHIVNVLLHLLNALLVWRIGRRLKIPGAWFVAAVFALHPVHVESVAWITERKNVLSGLFFLLSLRTYLIFDDSGRWRDYAAALMLFVAALLSKSVTSLLPVVLPLILYYKNNSLGGRQAALLAPFLVIGAAAGLHTAYLEQTKVGAHGIVFNNTILQRLLIIAPSAFCFYALKILWPHPLMFNYPRWDVTSGEIMLYIPFFILVLALAVLLLGGRRFRHAPLFLLLYSAITLFPALGFINVFPHRYSYVADHFQYLGSLGFIILFVIAGIKIGKTAIPRNLRGIIGRSVAGFLLILLSALTFSHARSYENEERLWLDTVQRNPDSWFAMANLGAELSSQGRYEEAAGWFQKAADYENARPEALHFWGRALQAQGRVEEAINKFQEAIQVDPDYFRPFMALGGIFVELGRWDEAEKILEEALERWPDLTGEFWYQLAAVREHQGRMEDVSTCLQRAVEIEPRNILYQFAYGRRLGMEGQFCEAAEHLRMAYQANLEDASARLLLVQADIECGDYLEAVDICRRRVKSPSASAYLIERAAWLFAACPVDSLRDPVLAGQLLERLQLSFGASPSSEILQTYAAVAAANGDFQSAIRWTQIIIERAEESGDETQLLVSKERLESYQNRKLWLLRSH
ncbi:MAG: tetratricopeptide repeat protein [Candidatus Eisenbacteria bacterium]|uniref:Tetratricopeptide repeat protein n=1 Tax=Eiseniibacteriota bacterium TaxID=2212470 RepID=A0A948RXD5_UNCEI|nr:tetratricopeptide repeat protein [Candidatus Eisenbacteria bacterium]MBU1951222.1 tetratricopeptide repeat protein [Candidatus Eisenbacteria bacterium]MBU2691349.1 tetratricopeptide repeat protein [Candidatus Eisenbacteria bacterium]